MRSIIFGISFLLGLASITQAFELDWDTVDWNSGVTSQTFRNVDGSGVDIQITLSISSGQWSYNSSLDGQRQPNDNIYYDGNYGHNNGEESLMLFPDFINDNHTNAYVDVVIRFSQAQSYVNFDLFDVDHGSYWSSINGWEFEDVIENIEGSKWGQDAGDATVTAGSEILVDTATEQGDTLYRGDSISRDDASATVGIAWSDQPVDTVSFRYSSGSRAGYNPGDQAIGLSDIRFSNVAPVPEASTVVVSSLLFFMLSGVVIRKKMVSKRNEVSA